MENDRNWKYFFYLDVVKMFVCGGLWMWMFYILRHFYFVSFFLKFMVMENEEFRSDMIFFLIDRKKKFPVRKFLGFSEVLKVNFIQILRLSGDFIVVKCTAVSHDWWFFLEIFWGFFTKIFQHSGLSHRFPIMIFSDYIFLVIYILTFYNVF